MVTKIAIVRFSWVRPGHPIPFWVPTPSTVATPLHGLRRSPGRMGADAHRPAHALHRLRRHGLARRIDGRRSSRRAGRGGDHRSRQHRRLAAGPGRPTDDLWVIRGAEFSTVASNAARPVSVHLLGYLFDPAHPAIIAEQTRLREERLHRGMAIVQKMVDDGVPISAEQVMAFADGAPIGRPHIGRALVESGVVSSVDEAFSSYLAGPGKYYVRKADTDLPTAIEMIAAAGGVSVIAHPRGRGEYRALSADYISRTRRSRTRRTRGRPSRPLPGRTRRITIHRRPAGPADHRILGLPRAQQGAPARPGDDRPRGPAPVGAGHQRGHCPGRAGRRALVTAGRLPVGVRVLDLLAGLLSAGIALLGVLLLFAALFAPTVLASAGLGEAEGPGWIRVIAHLVVGGVGEVRRVPKVPLADRGPRPGGPCRAGRCAGRHLVELVAVAGAEAARSAPAEPALEQRHQHRQQAVRVLHGG